MKGEAGMSKEEIGVAAAAANRGAAFLEIVGT